MFLTIYIIISFHFLNPSEFTTLIEQRVLDTLIGSMIAGIAARFILPVWGREEINLSLHEMLKANYNYFNAALVAMGRSDEFKAFNKARNEAVVALTNLSDNFQRILTEPKRVRQAEQLHQFVIASHILNGHIAALSQQKIPAEYLQTEEARRLIGLIRLELGEENNLFKEETVPESTVTSQQLSVIYTLAHEIRLISVKMNLTLPVVGRE